MKQSISQTTKKNWFEQFLDGYAWVCHNRKLLTAFLLLYALLLVLIGWHTNQALCYFAGTQYLCGISYLVIGWLGMLTLFHEAEHVWKHKWVKVPIGILSAWFIYYCMMDVLWLTAETALGLSMDVGVWGSFVSAGLSAVLVAVGYWNTKHIRTVSYCIPIKKSEQEFCIALISDLHLGAFVAADHVMRIVEAVNAIHPDLIVVAGDLIDEDNSILSEPTELLKISRALRRLQSRYGTVLTLGNHDPDAADPVFRSFLEESRITLLHNQILELPAVNVIGVSDPTRNKRIPIESLMADRNPAKPTVVVDHDPRYMDTAVAQNADLVLSGHTHAGQFFPASVLTRIALGKHRFYGHHKAGATHTVVTSGAGFFNLPVRIGTRSEVVELVVML